MSKIFVPETIGVLGGGQLGRMLIQAGIDYGLDFKVLDPDPEAPCSKISDFHVGSLTDFDTVYHFGRTCSLLTIEIENVNVAALKKLEGEGVKVFPQPKAIETIQDKGIQKDFYREHKIPTSEYRLIESKDEIKPDDLPCVQKLRTEGYDGRGVQILRTEKDLAEAFDKPSVVEQLVEIEKEISVIVARNEAGEVKAFPAVEMVFHPEHNLVDYLISPAQISEDLEVEAQEMASKVIEKLDMVGILAVEMFIDQNRDLLVNESAPRPHNSGHQSIEGNLISQYQQMLRALLNLPLGDTSVKYPSAMLNLLGEKGQEGATAYEGFESLITQTGFHPHFYGKEKTRPHRKMGHVTITGTDRAELVKKLSLIRGKLKVVSK